jgi:hypothetical protein
VGHNCYNNQAIMREKSTFAMIIEPECEGGAHYVGSLREARDKRPWAWAAGAR